MAETWKADIDDKRMAEKQGEKARGVATKQLKKCHVEEAARRGSRAILLRRLSKKRIYLPKLKGWLA